MPVSFDRKALRWGNGWGIRLTKKEADELGVSSGAKVHVEATPAMEPNDLTMFPMFHVRGVTDASQRVHDLAADEAYDDWMKTQTPRRRRDGR